jgi:hypothetical protein
MKVNQIYIAGSSSDLARVKAAADAAEAAGYTITEKWWETVEKNGTNPPNASRADKRKWSEQCLRGVAKADIVWVLAPPTGSTIGAWIEFGYAIGGNTKKLTAISGNVTSIFTAMAGICADTDEQALTLIVAAADVIAPQVRGA